VSPSVSPSEIPGEPNIDYLFQQDLTGGKIQVFPSVGLGTCPLGMGYLGFVGVGDDYAFDTSHTGSQTIVYS